MKILSLFLLTATAAFAEPTPHAHDYFQLGNGLQNSRLQFETTKKGRVAFLGGSITTMEGWRGMTYTSLKERFPETKFDFVHAGIPSVDSTGDAFRLMRDVFGRGQVDLLFVEATVNDLHNGRNSVERIRAMEGIVRQARRENPNIDIVIMCFVDVPYVKEYTAGKTPEIIADHLKVAKHYNVASIDMAKEVTERINAGEFEWAKFRNCHPSPFGHTLYHSTINRMFDAAWKETGGKVKAHAMPDAPLDGKNYQNARLVDFEKAEIASGWKTDVKWKPSVKAGTRDGFVGIPMLVAEEPGATLKLKFKGTSVGMFVVAGPDAGVVEYSIDGGPKKTLNQFTKWSGGLYLPWPFVFDADLADGEHELVLTNAGTKTSKGHPGTTRIVKFLVN